MLTSGDVITVDLGTPVGREAGFVHPAVVVSAQPLLDASPSVVQVVPLTSTLRAFAVEVTVPDDASNGLDRTSAAQCQHVRAVSVRRLSGARGNVGAAVLTELREVLGLILDVPG